MESVILYTRRLVEIKKKQFNETGENQHVLEAAVIRGIYCGMGGTKTLHLPPYCSIISGIVKPLVKAKVKFKGIESQDLIRLNNEFVKEIDSIMSIEMSRINNRVTVSIYTKTNLCPILIETKHGIENKGLAEIATILIGHLSREYRFNSKELAMINDTISAYMYFIDRRLKK